MEQINKRAAYTRKKELLDSGFSEKDIDVQRIDNKEDLQKTWDMWEKYDKIDGFDIYSHGYETIGPEVAGGSGKFWGNEARLNWTKNAVAVFHGCHTAKAAHSFAWRQGVTTYGQSGYASFSSDPIYHKRINGSTTNVYLYDFDWPSNIPYTGLGWKNINGQGERTDPLYWVAP